MALYDHALTQKVLGEEQAQAKFCVHSCEGRLGTQVYSGAAYAARLLKAAIEMGCATARVLPSRNATRAYLRKKGMQQSGQPCVWKRGVEFLRARRRIVSHPSMCVTLVDTVERTYWGLATEDPVEQQRECVGRRCARKQAHPRRAVLL